jgi:hypothetical protein
MEALAQISDTRKDTHSYLAFKEGAIAIRPDDQSGRSSLAYKYFDTGENDLALYHFRIVVNDKPEDSAAWNNLGVSASRLSLQSRAVEAYRRAEQLGDTLAMSNLAHKLINEGFLKDADQLCEKAIRLEEYDRRIGHAIARITKVHEDDEKKEKSLLLATNSRRSFYVEYAHACLDKPPGTLPTKWKGEDCELDVTVNEGVFEASGSFKQPKTLGGLLGALQDNWVTLTLRWTGILLGRGAKFRLQRKENDKPQTILGELMNQNEGLMIISENLREIKFYEKADEGKGKFYKWESVDGPN